MRLIHEVGFKPEEIESFRQLVFNNLVHGMRLVLEAMAIFRIGIDEANLVGPVSIPFHCKAPSPVQSLTDTPLFVMTGIRTSHRIRSRPKGRRAIPHTVLRPFESPMGRSGRAGCITPWKRSRSTRKSEIVSLGAAIICVTLVIDTVA
jgi:hypothetical protein